MSEQQTVNVEALQMEKASFESIAEIIHSESSPVGIDAKKTHILILQQLLKINQRLERLEQKVAHMPAN